MSNYSSLFRVLSPSRVQTKFEENSPTSTDIMLGCIVLGEENAFPVDFDTNKTIGHLKGAIKEQAGLAEPAHKLILWHVNIPENEKHEIYEGINIEEKFGGVKLVSDLKIIGQEFKKQPPSEHIHIIVELPATTGKRRHRDSDLDEESRTPKKERQTPKTLDSLLTSSILQPHITNTPSHKFYDRDQALHSMLEVARSNYQGRKNPDHKAHMFILIPGGIGIGKTRMGWESKYLSSIPTTRSGDADAFIEALKDPCYIFIDLNNGSKYIEDLDDKETPSIRIGTRVAVASGLIPKCSRLHDLIKTNTTELFQFSDVICEILKRRSKKVEAIIIHLDEYQLYINDVQNYQQQTWTYSRDFFKLMLREIGNVMRGNNIESEFKGKYFIIPICTGTSAIDIHFLPTEHTQKLLELEPLNYKSAKSMFLDKYEYSRQTTDEGRDLVVQGLKSRDSSDFNNENIEKLSTDFCNFVLNQQHFQIAISDTGFIPKFIDDLLGPSTLMSDFDWGNQLFIKISNRNIVKIGKDPGNWKSLNDIRTVISFGLTRQLINRDFRLTSGMSIGELERSGLIYLSNIKDEWFIIVMPFMLLKVLNNKLLTSNVEDIKPVFQDNLLFIPTHENPWQWQNFELLFGHFQKALIDSLIYVQESKIKHIEYGIRQLQKDLKEKGDVAIEDDIESQNKELDRQKRHNWQLSDIFRGALGADTLLQRKVRLHNLKVFTENKKFLVKTDDVASFDESVLCDDNITRSLEEGIFRCYQGNANIDHRWILDSANNGKKLAIFSQIKYSERGVTTKMSTPAIKEWYDTTMASVKNYETEYDVVLVLFTNRTITGNINIETMPHLLLIYPDNIEMYLSPAFAHRGLVDGPSENDDG